MRKTLLYIIFAIAFQSAIAQNGTPSHAGARGVALGNSGVAFTDIQSAFGNQAGLAFMPGFSATVFGEQRFSLNEIRSFSAAAALPVDFGTFGLAINYFGFEGFNEQKIGLSYSRKLMEKLAVGVQFDFLNTKIPVYGSKALMTFEVGLLSQLIKDVQIGVHIYSPARVELVEDESLPTIFKLGLAYSPSKKVFITGELEKDLDQKALLRAGFEYNFVEALYLRAGFATDPALINFGLGYKTKNGIGIDVASSYHQVLGFSPAVSISFGQLK